MDSINNDAAVAVMGESCADQWSHLPEDDGIKPYSAKSSSYPGQLFLESAGTLQPHNHTSLNNIYALPDAKHLVPG
jgi:hypothetical protein